MWELMHARNGGDRVHEDIGFHKPENPNVIRDPVSWFGVRHLQCFMIFLGWATAYSVRVNLSLAIVAMTQEQNETNAADFPVVPWTQQMQGVILSAFFWGYVVLHVTGGLLAEKFGPKVVLSVSIFFCGILTVLTPYVSVHGGFYWMVLWRFLLGMLEGMLFPTIIFFLTNWTPLSERGRLTGLIFSGNHMGNVLTMATAGKLADSRWGWPSIFYVTGGVAILWALVYWCIGSNSPRESKTISESERMYILRSHSNNSSNRMGLKTPWRAILTSVPVWTLMISISCEAFGYFTLLTQIPKYINGALHFSMTRNGLSSALPYVASFITCNTFARISDVLVNKKILTRSSSRKFWNTVAFWGPAFALLALAFSGTIEGLALLSLVASMGFYPAAYLGVYSNPMDLCPNFSGTVMGTALTMGNLVGSLGPLYAGFIVDDPTSLAQWRIVFLTSAASLFAGNIFFLTFGTVQVQPWNFPVVKEAKALATSEEGVKGSKSGKSKPLK